MRVKNESLISDNVDLATSSNLRPVWIGHAAMFSVQIVFTGIANGTMKLQASNDVGNIDGQALTTQDDGISNWTDIPSQSQALSTAGAFIFIVPDAPYNWFRVVWTAAGSGTTPVLTSARAYIKGV